MKKVGILCIVTCALFAFSAINLFAEDAGLKVTAKNGKVFVKSASSGKLTELNLGQMVYSKDVIKTDLCDPHSKEQKTLISASGQVCPVCGAVTLELPDKSSISLKPDSEVTIDELVISSAARKLKVTMTIGELRTIITKVNTPSEFVVNTPAAICGATGTIFYTKSTAAGTSVYVQDGALNCIDPTDGTIYTVLAGMMITFNADGTVTGPVPVSDVDVSNWTACYADDVAEPFIPAGVGRPDVTPPVNTSERPASGA